MRRARPTSLGRLFVRGLSRAFTKATEQARQQQAMTSDVTRRSAEKYRPVFMCMSWWCHEEIELPKATILGVAEETSVSIIADINYEKTSYSGHTENTPWG